MGHKHLPESMLKEFYTTSYDVRHHAGYIQKVNSS